MSDHVSHRSSQQMRFVCIYINADADRFGCANCFGNWHSSFAAGKHFTSVKKQNLVSSQFDMSHDLRQELCRIFVDFEQFSWRVVIEIADGFAYVLAAINDCLILATPRFNVDDRNACIESAEVLLRYKWTIVPMSTISNSPNQQCWQLESHRVQLQLECFRFSCQT